MTALQLKRAPDRVLHVAEPLVLASAVAAARATLDDHDVVLLVLAEQDAATDLSRALAVALGVPGRVGVHGPRAPDDLRIGRETRIVLGTNAVRMRGAVGEARAGAAVRFAVVFSGGAHAIAGIVLHGNLRFAAWWESGSPVRLAVTDAVLSTARWRDQLPPTPRLADLPVGFVLALDDCPPVVCDDATAVIAAAEKALQARTVARRRAFMERLAALEPQARAQLSRRAEAQIARELARAAGRRDALATAAGRRDAQRRHRALMRLSDLTDGRRWNVRNAPSIELLATTLDRLQGGPEPTDEEVGLARFLIAWHYPRCSAAERVPINREAATALRRLAPGGFVVLDPDAGLVRALRAVGRVVTVFSAPPTRALMTTYHGVWGAHTTLASGGLDGFADRALLVGPHVDPDRFRAALPAYTGERLVLVGGVLDVLGPLPSEWEPIAHEAGPTLSTWQRKPA